MLTDDQVDCLRQMCDTGGWDVFRDMIVAQIRAETSILMTATDPTVVYRSQGAINGLNRAVNLVRGALRTGRSNDAEVVMEDL